MDKSKKEKTGFTELEDKYWRALRLIQTHVNEPDVVKSIVDKAIGAEEDVIPIEEPEYDGPNEDSKNFAADIQAKLNKAATEEKINEASGAEPTPTPHPKWDDEDLLETDDWKQSPYYSKAAQQINGWHSDADVRNLARQLRDADNKKHFGEGQAEGLDNLLEGLRDTPHDNRW